MDDDARARVLRAGVGAFVGACLAALAAALLAEPVFAWAFGDGGTGADSGNILEDAIVTMMTGLARLLLAVLVVGIVLIPLFLGLPVLGAGTALKGASYVGRTVLIGGLALAGLSWLGTAVLGPALGAGGFWAYPFGAAAVLAGTRAFVEHQWPTPPVEGRT